MLQSYQCTFALLPSMQHSLSHARMMGQPAGASQVDDYLTKEFKRQRVNYFLWLGGHHRARTWPVQDLSVALRRS